MKRNEEKFKRQELSELSITEFIMKYAKDINFNGADHVKFFVENVKKTKSENDTYRKSFFYTMGIVPVTRNRIERMYNFKDNAPNIAGLNEPWQSAGTLKICRLALNLYNGFHYIGETIDKLEPDIYGEYTPYELFSVPEAFYMLEAVKVRYPHSGQR